MEQNLDIYKKKIKYYNFNQQGKLRFT